MDQDDQTQSDITSSQVSNSSDDQNQLPVDNMDIDQNTTVDASKSIDDLTPEEIAKSDIIELMGFTTLSEEEKNKYRQMLEEMVQNRVAARIHDTLSAEERDEWEKLLEEEKHEEAAEYLVKHNIDSVAWYAEEELGLKFELYKDAQDVRKKAIELVEEERDATE